MATVNQAKEVFLTPPLSIAGCSLWLDAADPSTITGTESVTKVNDKSGNSVNLSNASGYSYPNNTFNRTYPSFFSTNGAASASAANLGYNAAFALTMPFSLFFVGIQTNTGTFGYLCDAAPASGGANRIYTYTPSFTFSTPFGGGVAASTTNFITDILYVAGTSASSVFVNGSSYVTGTVGQFTCSGITVANRFSLNEGFPGHICEVLAFNAGVTTIQRQQIEGYLAWKWGLQSSLVSGHPFASVSPYQTSKVPYSIGNAVKATLFGQYVFSSTTIAGCSLWLDGQDPAGTGIRPSYGTSISTWTDKSGNGLNATNTANYPTYSGSNLIFNGSQRLNLSTFIPSSTKNITIAAVWNCTSAGTSGAFQSIIEQNGSQNGAWWRFMIQGYGFLGRNEYMYGINEYGNNPTPASGFPTFVVGTSNLSFITQASSDGTNFTLSNYAYGSLYGTQTYSGAVTIGTTGTVGSNTNGEGFTGTISEIIIFTSGTAVLTTTQRQQVEGYLAWKWGIQTSLLTSHSYYTNSPIYTFPISVTRASTKTWSPLKVAGNSLWLDSQDPAGTGMAPANGAIVSSWVDKSGNGYNGTAVGTGAAYSSSQKALLFGSLTASPTGGQTSFPSGNYYTTSYTAAPTFETCFIVFNMPVIGYGFIITSNSCGGRSLATPVFSENIASFAGGVVCYTWGVTGLSSITASTTYIGEMISSSGNQTATVNGGTFAGPVSQSYSSGTTTVIGAYGVSNFAYYNGYLYEILFYNSILTTSQRQQVEGYLAWKWGLRSSLPGGHPYINFPPSP